MKEQQKYPDEPLLRKWVNSMRHKYGRASDWPAIGCNSVFMPWAEGMPMVAEVQNDDGQWMAFAADRLP